VIEELDVILHVLFLSMTRSKWREDERQPRITQTVSFVVSSTIAIFREESFAFFKALYKAETLHLAIETG